MKSMIITLALLSITATAQVGEQFGLRFNYTDAQGTNFPAAHLRVETINWDTVNNQTVIRGHVFRTVEACHEGAVPIEFRTVTFCADGCDYPYDTSWGINAAHIFSTFSGVFLQVLSSGPYAGETGERAAGPIANSAVAEEGSSLTFNVTLTALHAQEITVDYTTVDESASAGADYTATAGTLTFAPGDTAEVIIVETADDGDTESETMSIKLSNLVGGQPAVGGFTASAIMDSTATGTITAKTAE